MKNNIIIELIVNNHPGVISHITGLFARRAFNLEGILCGKIKDGTKSRVCLFVNNDDRLEQIIKQVEKLYDVLELNIREDDDHTLFNSCVSLLWDDHCFGYKQLSQDDL